MPHGKLQPSPPEQGSCRHAPCALNSNGSSGAPSSERTVAVRPSIAAPRQREIQALVLAPPGAEPPGGANRLAMRIRRLRHGRAPPLDAGGAGLGLLRHRRGEGQNARCRLGRDRNIRAKISDRETRLQRIGAELDDLAILDRAMLVGRPRRQAVDDEDDVGIADPGFRVHADVGRMVERYGQRNRPVLTDRNGPVLRQRRQRGERVCRTGPVLGDDQWFLGIGEQCRGLLDRCRRCRRLARRHRGRTFEPRNGARFAQDFARQAQINRPLRCRLGQWRARGRALP